MKRKKEIRLGEVKKYKARLNIDGSKMQAGKHYNQTYLPVAQWSNIRMVLAMAASLGWKMTQIDYVLAFQQAPVKWEMYIEIPKGFLYFQLNWTRDYILKLNHNVYGQKQARLVWNRYLVDKLMN